MPFATAVILRASTAQTSNATGAAVDIGVNTTLDATLNCTAVSGTSPNLTVYIDTSADGFSNWTQVGEFPSLVDIGAQARTITSCKRFVRTRWQLTGTSPSFTFGVTANAILVYASPADFRALALPSGALGDATDTDIDAVLRSETDLADGFLAVQYELPLVGWGSDLRGAVCDTAALRFMRRRGLPPDDPGVGLLVEADRTARAWYDRIAKALAAPPGIVDSSVDEFEGGAYVYSDVRRGW